MKEETMRGASHISDEELQRAVTLLGRGVGLSEIARRLGRDRGGLRKRLAALGLPTVPSGDRADRRRAILERAAAEPDELGQDGVKGSRRYEDEELAQVLRALRDGKTMQEAAAQVGRDRSGLHQRLAALDLPTTPAAFVADRRRAILDRAAAAGEAERHLDRAGVRARILELRDRRSA
jgi:hypothetical protein